MRKPAHGGFTPDRSAYAKHLACLCTLAPLALASAAQAVDRLNDSVKGYAQVRHGRLRQSRTLLVGKLVGPAARLN